MCFEKPLMMWLFETHVTSQRLSLRRGATYGLSRVDYSITLSLIQIYTPMYPHLWN